MRIAVTGGTGFVGRHLARRLSDAGHEVVLVARGVDRRDESVRRLARVRFAATGLDDAAALRVAFDGCAGVAHCAGINREIGAQTYARVHVEGTRRVVEAARAAGVRRLVLMSFLRARPDCGSPYHESKWAAEEIVRASDLESSVLKAGLVYGRGDHLLDHLSHALHTLPLFAQVGFRDQSVRPVAVEDLARIIDAALVGGRLPRRTVAVVGPEALPFGEAVRRVARAAGRRVLVFPLPVAAHRAMAWLFERTMAIPLVSLAQVRMLTEGIAEPWGLVDPLPEDLTPRTPFTEAQIRPGLPPPGRFRLRDLRWV